MIKFLKYIFTRSPAQFPEKTQHVIVEAFTIGNKKYFQFQDVFNAAYLRGLNALKYYDELAMRVNREFLELHVAAVDDVLNTPKKGVIELNTLQTLNNQLKERLKWIDPPEYIWKFASVVFFDESESPYNFDPGYAEKKIEFWKKTAGVKDFFLQQPLIQLIPFLPKHPVSWEVVTETINKLTEAHLEAHLACIVDKEKRKDLRKKFGLQEVKPVGLNHLDVALH